MVERGASFNILTSCRLTCTEYCRLGRPGGIAETVLLSGTVDLLTLYTCEMWDVLTDIGIREWFGIRLPPLRVPWDGPVFLPPGFKLRYWLDRTTARALRHDIQKRYLNAPVQPNRMSIFEGYGLDVADSLQREREGLTFLARQAEHFQDEDDVVLIVQQVAHDHCSAQ